MGEEQILPRNCPHLTIKKGSPISIIPRTMVSAAFIERQNKLHMYTADGKGVVANIAVIVEELRMKRLMKSN